jgi:uncharacterized protein (DUF433 family)
MSLSSGKVEYMPKVLHPHIVSDPDTCGGSPRVVGPRIPVRTIIVYVLHHGILPEELLSYYPQISLATIYDALSYYYDNRDEIDVEIATNAGLEPPAQPDSQA